MPPSPRPLYRFRMNYPALQYLLTPRVGAFGAGVRMMNKSAALNDHKQYVYDVTMAYASMCVGT